MKNIFNSFQKDFDKGEFRDAGYIYGPTLPRTVFLGIKLQL
jgi:outer membrane receptor for ferrienterochelin and colicins